MVKKYEVFEDAIICVKVDYFRLCSYLVQVHKICSNVKTHLPCSHVGAGSLLEF